MEASNRVTGLSATLFFRSNLDRQSLMAIGQSDLTRQTGIRLAMAGGVQKIVLILGEAAPITILHVDVARRAGAAATAECEKLVKAVAADRLHERNASVG